MFRIRKIILYRGIERKEYIFSDTSYVYGNNNVGKTALTKVIDYVLGSSELLEHAGLDNIEAVGAYFVNEKTELWVKRTIRGEFYYKRTKESGLSLVSMEVYKDVICDLITDSPDDKAIKVYKKVFEEKPTYRSFTFLNFLDEIGQGDLGAIFTRGKEIKHLVRIRNIMDFFFNYENIEKIYEKKMELDDIESKLRSYTNKMNQYNHSKERINKLFIKLGLPYSDDMNANYEAFKNFKESFSRTIVRPAGDIVYLTRASHSLSEELKLYSYLVGQSQEAENRKARTERLLSTLNSIIAENSEYKEEIKVITEKIENIRQDRLILSLPDHEKAISKIANQKKAVDAKIEMLRNQAMKLDYDDVLKSIALLEDHFKIIDSLVDISKEMNLNAQAKTLRKEIKELKNSYSQRHIADFNNRLTKMYLKSNICNVPYLNEDRRVDQFALSFDPFSQVLVAKRKIANVIESYTPGSMARHNHLQLLTYLCMLEHLHKNFANFIYLPVLIIDSADQPMEDTSFEEIYPSLIEVARSVGVQLIFISKYKPTSVNEADLIDITEGLNPFHVKNKKSSLAHGI